MERGVVILILSAAEMEKGEVKIAKNKQYQRDMDKAFAVINYNLRRLREQKSESPRRNSEPTVMANRQETEQEKSVEEGKKTWQRRVSFHEDVKFV